MNYSLPPELAEFVHEAVASGRYHSGDEVVCDGLRLLKDRERRLAQLREEVKLGLDQLDRGEGAPLDIAQIKAEVAHRLSTPFEKQ